MASTFEPEHKDPVPLGNSLEKLTKRLGGPSSRQMQVIFANWVDVVGEGVAAHAKPTQVKAGVLTVIVDQPAWATQINFLANDVISRLSELLGAEAPKKLQVKVKL